MKTTCFTVALAALVTSLAFGQLIGGTADGDLILGTCTDVPDSPHLQSCTVCLAPYFTWCEEQTCTKDTPPACGPLVRLAGSPYADVRQALSALDLYTEVLAEAQRAGNRAVEGYALGGIGLAYSALGDPRRAITMYDRALVIHRESGNRHREGSASGNLGLAYMDLGDARTALSFHERTLHIANDIGDQRGAAHTRYNMSLALDRLGSRAQAIAHAEAALEMLEEQRNPSAIIVSRQLAAWRDKP